MPEVKMKWEGETLIPDDDDQTSNVLLSRQVAHEFHAPAVQAIITAERAAAQAQQQAAMTEMDEFRKKQMQKSAEGKASESAFAESQVQGLYSRMGVPPAGAAAPVPTGKNEQLISESTGIKRDQMAKGEKLVSETTGALQSQAQRGEALISEGTGQRLGSLTPEMKSGTESPSLDPTMAMAAGAGAGFSLARSAGLPLVTSLGKAVAAGMVNAVTEYPIGVAAEAVSANVPELALPTAVVLGLFSGGTIEPILERGIANAAAKMGQALSPAAIKAEVKAAADMFTSGNIAGLQPEMVMAINDEIANTPLSRVMQALKGEKGELTIKGGIEPPAPTDGTVPVKASKSGIPQPPDMQKAAGEFMAKNSPDITGELAPGSNIRLRSVSDLAPKWLDQLGEGEDLTRVMASMSETFSDKIEESTRGVVSHAQTVLESQGLKVADVMGRQHATTLNAGQTNLLGEITVDSLSALFEMKKVIDSGQSTPVDSLKFAETFNGTYMAIMQYAGNAAELGRAVEIHKRIKRATGLKVGELKDFVQSLYGKEPEEIAKAMGDMDNFGKLATFVKQSHRATTVNMWNEAYINGMLWLPTTHMANITSNVLTDVMSVGERYVAAGISQSPIGSGQITFNEAQDYAYGMMQATKDVWRIFAQAVKTGTPSDTMNKLELSGVFEKSITGDNVASEITRAKNKLAKWTGRDLEKTVTPFEFEQGSHLKTFIDVVGDVTRIPGRMLMAEDEAGKFVAYRAELHALSRRRAFAEFSGNVEAANGYLKKAGIDAAGMDDEKIVQTAMANRIAEIIDDPVKHAADVHIGSQANARYLTYTSPITNSIVNSIRKSQNPFMKMLVPFTGTPYNIFRYTTERTPLFGFALRSMRDDFEAGGARRDLTLAKQAIGTMVWGVAVGMVLASGPESPVKVYGYGPREPNRRKAWLRDGHKPYSFEFGSTTVEYGRMEPFASVFGFAVDGSEILGMSSDKLAPETDKIFPAWMAATAQGYMSKTFLAGVSQGVKAFYEADANAMQRAINSWGKSAVPFSSALRGVEQLVSPQRKAVDGLFEAIASEIPGMSDKLPLQRDLWGRTMSKEIEKNESYLQMAIRATSPIYISKRQDSPIDKELYQNYKEGLPMPLHEQTFLGQFENAPRNRLIPPIPYEMTNRQYEQFIKFMNEEPLPSTDMTLKKSLDHMVKNDEQYKSEPDKKEKLEMIKSKISEAEKIARSKMYETDADIRRVVDELQAEKMAQR